MSPTSPTMQAGNAMKTQRTKERYYAVRIGHPSRNKTYWMLRPGTDVPELFQTRSLAQQAIDKHQPEQPTILRVTLSD